jgi:hypothetical protein
MSRFVKNNELYKKLKNEIKYLKSKMIKSQLPVLLKTPHALNAT